MTVSRALITTVVLVALIAAGAGGGYAVAEGRATEYDGVSTLQAHAVDGRGGRIAALLSATTGGSTADVAQAGASAVERADVVAEARSALGAATQGVSARAYVLPGARVEVTSRDRDRARAADRARAFATALRARQLATTREAYTRTARDVEAQATARRGPEVEELAADAAVLRTLAERVVPLQIVRVGDSRVVEPSPSSTVAALIGGAAGLLLGLLVAVPLGLRGRRRAIRREVDGRSAAVGTRLPAGGPVVAGSTGVAATPGARAHLRDSAQPARHGRAHPDGSAHLVVARARAGGELPVGAERAAELAELLPGAGPPRVVLFAAPTAGPSATAIALGAVGAVAGSGRRVLLVEHAAEDARGLAAVAGLEEAPGLADHLAGTVVPRAVLQPVPLDRLLHDVPGTALTPVAIVAGEPGGEAVRDGGGVDGSDEHPSGDPRGGAAGGTAATRERGGLDAVLDGGLRGYDLVVVLARADDAVGPVAARADAIVLWIDVDAVGDPLVEEAVDRLRDASPAPITIVRADRSRMAEPDTRTLSGSC